MPTTTDHDLLIRLDTKVDDLKIQVQAIKDDLVTRVNKVEARLDIIDLYGAQFVDAPQLAVFLRSLRSNIKIILFIGAPIYAAFIALIGEVIRRFFFH